ncbi:MAG: AAA-like domain-containing protein [Pseudomonadota bacterium]
MLLSARLHQGGVDRRIVAIDFNEYGDALLSSANLFFKQLALDITEQLKLPDSLVESEWLRPNSPGAKLTRLMDMKFFEERKLVLILMGAEVLLDRPILETFLHTLKRWREVQLFISKNGAQWSRLSLLLSVITPPFFSNDDERKKTIARFLSRFSGDDVVEFR